jgi:hypothetical protein
MRINKKNLIKKIIININKNIDINIKHSDLVFKNKKYKSININNIKNEFIDLMIKLSKCDFGKKKKSKIELISNYNTISAILDRLSVEKTKYHHFKNNMELVISKKQISSKCVLQKKIIKEINSILESKILEAFEDKIAVMKEERTFK